MAKQPASVLPQHDNPTHRFDEVRPQEPEVAVVKKGLVARLKSRVTGYRPKPKHLVFAALALLVLLRPWLVVGLILLTIFLFIGVFLILGYDGFWRRAMGLAILDRFPEGSVDGLYLPDFGDLATADKRHDEALDRRFSDMREGEA